MSIWQESILLGIPSESEMTGGKRPMFLAAADLANKSSPPESVLLEQTVCSEPSNPRREKAASSMFRNNSEDVRGTDAAYTWCHATERDARVCLVAIKPVRCEQGFGCMGRNKWAVSWGNTSRSCYSKIYCMSSIDDYVHTPRLFCVIFQGVI